ncbi:hypothetical protein T492DRAFT_941778 [Pavlovales sp. CCMP2436]|nr:hypothetical protein T492DRAFT_941778 [Pavlovales sp. CCMP2436]
MAEVALPPLTALLTAAVAIVLRTVRFVFKIKLHNIHFTRSSYSNRWDPPYIIIDIHVIINMPITGGGGGGDLAPAVQHMI